MQPLAAGRLDEGMHPLGLQRRPHRLGRRNDRRKIQSLVRVEVESYLFRRFRIARPTAPGVQLEPPRLGDGDQAADIDDGDIGFALVHVDQLQARVRPRHGVALEEGLAAYPVRRPDDRNRPVGDVWQNALRRHFVIAGQVRLGDGWPSINGRPQDLVGTGQGHPGDDDFFLAGARRRRLAGRGLFRRRRLRIGSHLSRLLVLAQSLVGRVPQRTALGQPAMLQFGDQDRPDPMDVLAAARRALADKGRGVRRRFLQGRQQGLQKGCGVTRPDTAEITQALVLGDADQKGPEPGPALRRPAADHDLVPAPAFGLDPGRGSAGLIGGVQFLGDHAFQVHPAGAFQHRLTGRGEVVDITKPRPGLGRDPIDMGLQARLAMRQGQVPKIVLPLAQQIEGEIDQVLGLAVGDGGLEGREVRRVVVA